MSDPGKDDVDRSSGQVGDDRLGEILHRVVPDGPDPTGRAEGVVRRGRAANRRRGAGGVLAVGLVALAVVIGPNLLQTPTAGQHGTIPGSELIDPSAGLAHPFTCAASAGAATDNASGPRALLPPGSVLARVCPSAGQGGLRWSPPADALVVQVGVLRRVLLELPREQPADFVCTTFPLSVSFTLTLQYPDGHLVAVAGSAGGCNVVRPVGGSQWGWVGASRLLEKYLELLQVQRSQTLPPVNIDPPTCPRRLARGVFSASVAPSLIPPDPTLDMTTAVICRYSDVLGEGIPPRVGTLTASQVRAVNASYRVGLTTSTTGLGCMNPVPLTTAIIGRTAWGDTVALSTWCTAWSRSQPGLSRQMYWTPPRSLADSLFARLHH